MLIPTDMAAVESDNVDHAVIVPEATEMTHFVDPDVVQSCGPKVTPITPSCVVVPDPPAVGLETCTVPSLQTIRVKV